MHATVEELVYSESMFCVTLLYQSMIKKLPKRKREVINSRCIQIKCPCYLYRPNVLSAERPVAYYYNFGPIYRLRGMQTRRAKIVRQ